MTNSVVVFAVRKGNPKNIRTWDDLIKPGIQVITPNPFTSGGARWNIMAAYGAQLKQGKTPEQANDYLKALFKNVPVQDDSARKALQTFTGGKGDVLLVVRERRDLRPAEAAADRLRDPGPDDPHRDPGRGHEDVEAPGRGEGVPGLPLHACRRRRIFADNGYRPVIDGVAKAGEFKTPPTLFTIADLGGWKTVTDKFFDPDTGIVAGIEKGIGVSTSK